MDDIKVEPQDMPISVVTGGADASLPYGVVNVHGMWLAQYATQEEADAAAEALNKPALQPEEPSAPEPELKQERMRDTAVKRAAKKRAKPKGRTMPRATKKKAVAKKRRRSAKPVVKTAAKKTMKRRKKRA